MVIVLQSEAQSARPMLSLFHPPHQSSRLLTAKQRFSRPASLLAAVPVDGVTAVTGCRTAQQLA